MSAPISTLHRSSKLSCKQKVKIEQPGVLKRDLANSLYSNISLAATSSSTEISTSSGDEVDISLSSSAKSANSSHSNVKSRRGRQKSTAAQSQRRGAKRTVSSSAASTSEAHKKLKYTKEPQGDVRNESEKQREETKPGKNTIGRKKYEDKDIDEVASKILKLEQNANTGPEEIKNQPNMFQGMDSLTDAAEVGDLENVRALIRAGHEVDVKTELGETPLLCSARTGHLAVVKELLSTGAEVNATDEGGRTSLHLAAYSGYADIVKELLSAGAEVNAGDESGFRPLHESVSECKTDVVKILILNGADVNVRDDLGLTPLHHTVTNRNADIVKLLISAGADASAVNNFGYTCFESTYTHSTYNSKAFVKYTLLYRSGSNLKEILKQRNELLKHYNECDKQVTNMKETLLGGSRVTFYEFITENCENKLALYSSEEKFGLTNGLDRISYTKKFPMYAKDIEEQFKKGSERAKLLHKSEKLLMLCFCHTLPPELIRKICESMTNADMENF